MFESRRSPLKFTTLLAVLAGMATFTPSLTAQAIGLEFGVAGVENHDPHPAFGVALFLPVFERLHTTFSYTQWPGRDGNSRPGTPASGFGNRGFKFLAHYRLIGSDGFSASLGGGLGLFEQLESAGDETNSFYEEALIGSVLLRKPVSPSVAPYVRIDLHVPTEGLRLNYGFLLAGVEVAFKR